MEKIKDVEAYYEEAHTFKNGIAFLRDLALKTEAIETCKWGMPVYTINGKNVFGICRFTGYFGIWFYNGVFMTDPLKVLENAQEGKTKAMRHWKFYAINEVKEQKVFNYLKEAIQNQKSGKVLSPAKPKKELDIPELFALELSQNEPLKKAFEAFSPYKKNEFCEYISQAKQAKTKIRRMEKIIPLILRGIGLNDAYR